MERSGVGTGSGSATSAGRRKIWNEKTMRSTESPESVEIELDEDHRSEHPRSPLIPDLTKPPSRRSAGSFKEFMQRSISIFVPQVEERMEPPSTDPDGIRTLFRYHLNDWLLIVILIILEIICQVLPPHRRYVGQTNFVTSELRYPYKRNTIPFQAVPVIGLGIPLFFIVGNFFWRRNARDLHHALLGLLTAVALTAVITDSVKDGIGRPRPHFYARCFGSPIATPNYDLVTGNVICILPFSQMKEQYKSFPSGHTSLMYLVIGSFAGLGYLAMYLAGKLRIFDQRGHSWKILPLILPLLGATFVGVTRIDDYWHHWTDVFAGAAIACNPYAFIPNYTAQAAAPANSDFDLERGS